MLIISLKALTDIHIIRSGSFSVIPVRVYIFLYLRNIAKFLEFFFFLYYSVRVVVCCDITRVTSIYF